MSLGTDLKIWAVKHGRESAVQMFAEGRRQGKITDAQLSLKDIAVATMGDSWPVHLARASESGFRGQEAAGDAVDPTLFAAITGNLLIDKIKEKYKSPDFIGDELCENIPVTNGNLDTQKVPWLSDVMPTPSVETDLTDQDEDIVQAGMNYPRTGFKPNYLVLGRPEKRGEICAVTFEMIYADRTKQAQDSAGSVGRRLGRSREYRILKVFLGLVNPFTFSFGGGTETNSSTYHSTAGTVGVWLNALNNTPLTNWTDINTAEQIFAKMVDPVTGQPIDIEPTMLFVMPGNRMNAEMIVHATNVRTGPYATSGATNTVFEAASQVKTYPIMTSKYAMKLANLNATFPKMDLTAGSTLTAAQAQSMWLIGNPKRAFYYREVHPLMTFMAPPMNPDEFNRDIVLQVKAREYGVAGVQDPYQMVRCYGHSFTDVTTAA